MKNDLSHARIGNNQVTKNRTAAPKLGESRASLRVQILDVLQRHPSSEMEELVRLCHSFTWNQIFLEVDRLSRTGELRLVPRGAGVYAVTLPQQPVSIS